MDKDRLLGRLALLAEVSHVERGAPTHHGGTGARDAGDQRQRLARADDKRRAPAKFIQWRGV